ncbi:unnamed protein product [Prorocentrum cordatum]|uniref:Protein RFT1 homolog n=1 Tax=Prorocentrum cordatum TaxID=2364126 RepID=A0ABN9VLC3_9DINO|nr:unnamed protein product [Polarella glacialis]
MASVLGVVSLVISSLYEALVLAFPGLIKLLPCHPMQPILKFAFGVTYGPFYGLSGDLLRSADGASIMAAGLGLLAALWGEQQLGLLGPEGPGSLLGLAQSPVVCAFCGSAWIFFHAAASHIAVGDKSGAAPPAVSGAVAVALLVCRLVVSPVNLALVGAFAVASLLLLVAMLTMRTLYGAPTAEIAEKYLEVKKAFEGDAAAPGPSMEPLAGGEA